MFLVRPISLAHSALLLAIFGSAGFKEEHTGLLAMTLPALLCNVPSTVSPLHDDVVYCHRTCCAAVSLSRNRDPQQ